MTHNLAISQTTANQTINHFASSGRFRLPFHPALNPQNQPQKPDNYHLHKPMLDSVKYRLAQSRIHTLPDFFIRGRSLPTGKNDSAKDQIRLSSLRTAEHIGHLNPSAVIFSGSNYPLSLRLTWAAWQVLYPQREFPISYGIANGDERMLYKTSDQNGEPYSIQTRRTAIRDFLEKYHPELLGYPEEPVLYMGDVMRSPEVMEETYFGLFLAGLFGTHCATLAAKQGTYSISPQHLFIGALDHQLTNIFSRWTQSWLKGFSAELLVQGQNAIPEVAVQFWAEEKLRSWEQHILNLVDE